MSLDLTTLDTLNAPPARPEPKRDRWGRYLITHPDTGKSIPWTRATTFASSVADTFGLTKWQLRMTATGLAQRPDLLAQVASSIPLDPSSPTKDEKATLDRLCEAAKEHAGASTRANQGTAIHKFCESADLGRPIPDGPWVPDVNAYRAEMSAQGFSVHPDHVERIVTVPEFQVAGTFDRLVHRNRLVVADLKTGRDLSYSWTEIAIQLALYANAATIYDPATSEHTRMPDVAKDVALVMHVPVGSGTCTLYTVDIAAGWEMAQVCAAVREWRKRRNLATPLPTIDDPVHVGEVLPKVIATIPDDPFAGLPTETGDLRPDVTVKRAWLVDRIETLRRIEGGVEAVAARWPNLNGTPVPTFKQTDQHSLDQLALIEQAIDEAEKVVRAPFNDPDPTDPNVILIPTSDPRVTGLVTRGRNLFVDLEEVVHAELHEAGVPKLTGTRAITAAQLATAEQIIAAQEPVAEARRQRIWNALQIADEHDVLEVTLEDAIGVATTRHITDRLAGVLDDLVDAIAHPDRVIVERGGRLVVDQPAVVLAAHGNNRSTLLAAGRKAAVALGVDSPKDSDSVLSSPVLTAAVLAV